jgi:predicted alpha/beta hydrolase family esterase
LAKVLIIHGWGNRRLPEHWQHRLAIALRQGGHQVWYPQLPATDEPVYADWSEVVLAELAQTAEVEGGETIVIAHSLGCVTWLKLALEKRVPFVVDRLLLVAPADTSLLAQVPTFEYELRGNAALEPAVKASARSVGVVGSDEDPWAPRGVQETFGVALGVDALLIEGAKHLSLPDGWGPWQGVIDWVNDPAADLTRR